MCEHDAVTIEGGHGLAQEGGIAVQVPDGFAVVSDARELHGGRGDAACGENGAHLIEARTVVPSAMYQENVRHARRLVPSRRGVKSSTTCDGHGEKGIIEAR